MLSTHRRFLTGSEAHLLGTDTYKRMKVGWVDGEVDVEWTDE